MNTQITNLFYLVAAILFIVALKMLTSPRTARLGNALAAGGMLLAIVGAFLGLAPGVSYSFIIIGLAVGAGVGATFALRVKMTAIPQMVSLFNGSGGLAAALVSIVNLWSMDPLGGSEAVEAGISATIGWITFTGSMVAALKLQEWLKGSLVFRMQKELNAGLLGLAVLMVVLLGFMPQDRWLMFPMIIAAGTLGVLFVWPIGGADMPVVISLLNSMTGIAAGAAGFLLGNSGLIISGALVGASGAVLTVLMCRAMNRSLANVLFSGLGATPAAGPKGPKKTVRRYSAEDAAIVLKNASRVCVIPGYGLAVARAQHVLKELAAMLEQQGITVTYAIHPVAGRMPGHMNVLMAEADIPYSQLMDLEPSNAELDQADVALVVGANDVVNPVARTDKSSPIFGMPILNADHAKTVMIIKRSLSPGFAGIDNPLFYEDKTMMLFGDAKEMLTEMVAAMKN